MDEIDNLLRETMTHGPHANRCGCVRRAGRLIGPPELFRLVALQECDTPGMHSADICCSVSDDGTLVTLTPKRC
jgi:hypothetical protein